MPIVNPVRVQPGEALSVERRRQVVSYLNNAKEVAGFNVSDLAHAADVDQGYLSRILQGKFKKVTPAISRLCRVADELMRARGDSNSELIRKSLRREVVLAWDGTREGANNLLRFLKDLRKARKGRGHRKSGHL